jgi:hypothetical protein
MPAPAGGFAPYNAIPCQTSAGTLAPVNAIAVVVINDGSVPVAPINAQAVTFVTSAYPLEPDTPIPIVVVSNHPDHPVSPAAPIPVFQVGTVP